MNLSEVKAQSYGQERTVEQQSLDRRVRVRVARGIKLLKEKYGDDWVERMRPEHFAITSGASCILGQLYGGYEKGCDILGLESGSCPDDDPDSASYYGFMAARGDPEGRGGSAWSALQREWERVLNDRAE